MRVVITGATGFIGRKVVEALLARDHHVIAVARAPEKFEGVNWADKVEHCIFDLAAAGPDAFELLGKPDLCMHLAWGKLADFNSLHHVTAELPAHLAFLTHMIEGGLKQLLVTGTCLEYGLQSGALSEDLPTNPVTPYGLAKDMLRRSLEMLQVNHSFSLAWGRLFYIEGEGPGRKTLLMLLKAAVERGDATFPMSGGEQLRDYLPIAEVADRLVRLGLEADNPGIVNICSGKPVSVRRLVERWITENDWKIELELGRYPYPPYEPLAFWGDTQRFDQITKYN